MPYLGPSRPAPALSLAPEVGESPALAPAPPPTAPSLARGCPPEMVPVRGAFCVDRYEASLVDARSGLALPPYYPPSPALARRLRDEALSAAGAALRGSARPPAVPELGEALSSGARVEPRAVSAPGVLPNGYLSALVAREACGRAGKRLCTAEEWVTACRGSRASPYPYGARHQDGRCNVFRDTHPARVLHGDASRGHLDPRLHLVVDAAGAPLLRSTGATPGCLSEWEGGAVADLVGNLDEWVDDPDGTFLGGFYARATDRGCEARVEVHSPDYLDYSLGTRCCLDLGRGGAH